MTNWRTALVVIGAVVSVLPFVQAQVTTSSLANTNLVRNASFEDGLTAWAGGGGAQTVMEARDGLYALTLSGERAQRVRLEPGERYELRAWGRGDGAISLGDATLTFDIPEMREKRLTFTAPKSVKRASFCRPGLILSSISCSSTRWPN